MTTTTNAGKRKFAKLEHGGASDKNGSKGEHRTAPTKKRKVTHAASQQEPAPSRLNTEHGGKKVKKRKRSNDDEQAKVESAHPPPKKQRRAGWTSGLWENKSTQALNYVLSRLSAPVPFSQDLHDHLLQTVWYDTDVPDFLLPFVIDYFKGTPHSSCKTLLQTCQYVMDKTAKRHNTRQRTREKTTRLSVERASASFLERTRAMAILDGMKPNRTSVEYTVIASHVLIVTRID
ncbi:hypothetical protein DENSPDRAFT_12769 [Dentipellis sp. KUC8613]|nr:hypothetical protein DENSPDRAFT_12769 [Dentipellis sp. KUC8613]